MERKFAKTCAYAVIIAILAAGMVAVATNDNIASAQTCSAQLGTPYVSAESYYYGNSLQVVVPVSTSCSSYVGPLYAIGTAYYNGVNVGTANTALNPSNNGFSGQLTFNIPTWAGYNSVQFSVSIYSAQNGYGGSLLTTASVTYILNSSNYPSYGYYPYYPNYQYHPTYPSYPSSPSNTYNPGGNNHYSGSNPSYPNYQHNSGNDCSNSSYYCYNNGGSNHNQHH